MNYFSSLDSLGSLGSLDSLSSLGSLDSMGSLDSSYSLPRFIVSNIIDLSSGFLKSSEFTEFGQVSSLITEIITHHTNNCADVSYCWIYFRSTAAQTQTWWSPLASLVGCSGAQVQTDSSSDASACFGWYNGAQIRSIRTANHKYDDYECHQKTGA